MAKKLPVAISFEEGYQVFILALFLLGLGIFTANEFWPTILIGMGIITLVYFFTLAKKKQNANKRKKVTQSNTRELNNIHKT